MRGKEWWFRELLLAVGASARCGEECYIRQLLLFSSASSVFVSFFWSRQLNGLGLRPRQVGSRRPGGVREAPGKLPKMLGNRVTGGLQSSRREL